MAHSFEGNVECIWAAPPRFLALFTDIHPPLRESNASHTPRAEGADAPPSPTRYITAAAPFSAPRRALKSGGAATAAVYLYTASAPLPSPLVLVCRCSPRRCQSMIAAAPPSVLLPSTDPVMSWSTSPLRQKRGQPCANGPVHGKLRRYDCLSRTSVADLGVRGGTAVSPTPVASTSIAGVILHRPSAVVIVPDSHAAWLSATSLRYNDSAEGMALNKTARNAVEWAAAVLSVETVSTVVATTGATPLQGAVSATGAATESPRSEGGDGVSAMARAQPLATAFPALSVRLASGPLQFVNAVAARLSCGGVRSDGGGGGGSDDLRRSTALGLILTAVRQVGGSEVFTRRWGRCCDTIRVYADVGVFVTRGGGGVVY